MVRHFCVYRNPLYNILICTDVLICYGSEWTRVVGVICRVIKRVIIVTEDCCLMRCEDQCGVFERWNDPGHDISLLLEFADVSITQCSICWCVVAV